ncbi:MAG TPA: hypothetical protein DEV85_14095 [Vibrio sp.]|nr:hypothetical protein [Vibrio sp.]
MPKLKPQRLEGQERFLTAKHHPPSFNIHDDDHSFAVSDEIIRTIRLLLHREAHGLSQAKVL